MNRTHPQAKTADDVSKDVDQAVRDEEARKLKAIYRERKRDNPALTQEHIADLCEWSGQSVVSQYLNGRIPLNLPALLKFSKVLEFNVSDVSPRLAAPLIPAWTPDARQPESVGTPARRHAPDLQPIEVWDDETPLAADEVELPFFKESEISAGKGSQVTLEIHGRKLRFGKRTLSRKNIDPQAAGCVPVTGNSMEPVLPHGSTVGVDTAAVTVQDGKMYAIDHDGQLRVKLLYRIPGGGLRLRSYNDAEHPDERYDKDYVEQHIRVIGKVFWYSVLL